MRRGLAGGVCIDTCVSRVIPHLVLTTIMVLYMGLIRAAPSHHQQPEINMTQSFFQACGVMARPCCSNRWDECNLEMCFCLVLTPSTLPCSCTMTPPSLLFLFPGSELQLRQSHARGWYSKSLTSNNAPLCVVGWWLCLFAGGVDSTDSFKCVPSRFAIMLSNVTNWA